MSHAPVRQPEAFSTLHLRSLWSRVRFEIRVVKPASVRPLHRPSHSPICTEFKSEIVKWIGTKRLCFLVLSFDAVDVNTEDTIIPPYTLKNFVTNPRSRPRVRTDEDHS